MKYRFLICFGTWVTDDKQNIYLFSQIKSVPKKRTYLKKTKKHVSSRNVSIQYFVKIKGIDVKICKQEFLAVHGLQKSKKRIQLLCEQMKEGASTPKADKRDKHQNKANKINDCDRENVKTHIKSIPKYISHYSRQKNPNKVYIDHDLSISALYHDYYLEWCRNRNANPVKESYYRNVLTDTCKTCDSLNIQIRNVGSTEASAGRLKTQLELHHRRAEALQKSLKGEIENAKRTKDTLVISFDLQQALPVPSLTVGPAFYLRKIWTYNLGIHDCVEDMGYMYMWPEHLAKRRSDEIASILYKHFKENPTEHRKLVVYSDNCAGQNKNWTIVCLWQQLVKESVFDTIEHRFLVVGHTHLPSDRDLAIIEKHKRRYLNQVYTPDDWYQAVLKSKRKNPYNVIVLQQQDILSFKDLQIQNITKKTQTENKEKLNFSKICTFKFTHETPNVMFYKHIWNELFKSVNIGRRGVRTAVNLNLRDLKIKYDAPIPLNPKKYLIFRCFFATYHLFTRITTERLVLLKIWEQIMII
ncbi:uncharacterized protein [Diabrotica undecimpunctata]|uniref:uncharacterized protein n=1 Tax=Diabrotica undecimpunctata TaxID=50387 RepID=UPI003B63C6AA